MYKHFFGLREYPFSVSPDPRFLVSTPENAEALASLACGIEQRRGFILLTGEVGTGKTTILNKFLDWLRGANVASAFVFNPRLNAGEFLDFMMTDFGIPCESDLKSQKLIRVNQWLVERYRSRGTAVLVVDEAQNLSAEVLEEIRLLTNLETSREKLLQIVLSGQPELEYKLKQPELRQLLQRITLRCKTRPLTQKQVETYINERLRIAGRKDEAIFSPMAVGAIHEYSCGVPRIINLLCDHALIAAYVANRNHVTATMIDAVAEEFNLDGYAISPRPSQAEDDSTQSLRTIALDYLSAMDEGSADKLLSELKGSYEPNPRRTEKS